MKPTHKSAICRKCGCTIIVWRRKGIRASLARKLATADHILSLHTSLDALGKVIC